MKVKKKRLIDADDVAKKLLSLTLGATGIRDGKRVLFELLSKYREGILQLIKEQPAVDAVEVVRCKGCARYEPGCIRPEYGWCEEWNATVRANGYCHNGERKADG